MSVEHHEADERAEIEESPLNRAEVIQLVTVVKALWPGWAQAPATRAEFETTAATWLALLGDIGPNAASAAVQSLSAEGRDFAPAVGVIRRRAIELVDDAAGTAPPAAAEAWREVRELIRAGAYPQTFAHSLVTDVVTAIGWWSLCNGDEGVGRSNFLRLYAEAVDGHWRARLTPPGLRLLLDEGAGAPVAALAP
jgi:hypothetical protein